MLVLLFTCILLGQSIHVAYGVLLLEWINILSWAIGFVMHYSFVFWELEGMVGNHESQSGQVLVVLLVSQILKIPNKHRKAQLMLGFWCELLIVDWKVTEINILGS